MCRVTGEHRQILHMAIAAQNSMKQRSMAVASVTASRVVTALILLLLYAEISVADIIPRNAETFDRGFQSTFGSFNMEVLNEGRGVSLVLSKQSGSGFRSKDSYLYGTFGTRMKLVPANSAGIVVSFYLSSETSKHDEIDFEFLGNISGEPWILQTNIFANGIGEREERIHLWFDPAEEHHAYWVMWNDKHIVFYVDDTPVREYKNKELELGVPYPQHQPMALFSSIFDGSDWATRSGVDKIDWSESPFTASYEKFEINACTAGMTSNSIEFCRVGDHHGFRWEIDEALVLGPDQTRRLREARGKYLIYSYCTHEKRFFPPGVPPKECSTNN